MAAIETTRSSFSPVGTAGRISALPGLFFSFVQGWADARATHTALSRLDDRTLNDIGMTRADVDRLAGF